MENVRALSAIRVLIFKARWSCTRQAERAKELAAVKISKADVKLIVEEMEIDEDAAELALREAAGDVVTALRTLTN